MLTEQQKHYHLDRARAELDMAYKAAGQSAAAAHVRLFTLYMGRLKELDETCQGSRVSASR